MTQQSAPKPLDRATYLWIEVGVILLTCVAPLIYTSAADVYHLYPTSIYSFTYHALFFVVEYVGQISLLLFIIWRSSDSFRRFGLAEFRIVPDLIGGVGIYVLLRFADLALRWALHRFLSHADYLSLMRTEATRGYADPSGAPEYVLLAAMCLLSGFGQELVMRAYLITRFEELLDSTPIALLLSTVLFTCYHGYQGTAGVISVAIFGLLEGILFCLFRRVAPIGIAHAVNNFFAIGRIRLPNGFRL